VGSSVEKTTNGHVRRLVIFAVIVLAVLAADQFSKYMVLKHIPLHGGFEAIQGYVNLVHARNTGGAFGMWAGTGGWFFTGVSFVALAAILWLVLSSRDDEVLLTIGYSLFFGGALGNLVDRLRFGEVVDFIDFHVGAWHWPAFNVADSSLCAAVALIFLHFLTERKR
jgi:signal peptidase II